jgi:transcriptional regulator with XRE-family HTH domain
MNHKAVSPVSAPKYQQVAARIRAQIADGTLSPGESVPSGAALSRVTGYSALTCRKALRALIRQGVLVPGPSENARPRVPSRSSPGSKAISDARHCLSESLATLRRAAGLTQPQLAKIVGVSVTTIGHAETGRLWQSRRFWERADEGLNANGNLLALHDTLRAEATRRPRLDRDSGEQIPGKEPPTVEGQATGVNAAHDQVACVTITWANGEATTVYPPPTHRLACSPS